MTMVGKAKYSGLCETCDYDATCTLRRCTQLKIVQCEEFSIQSSAPKPVTRSEAAAIADVTEATVLGICANCLNVLSCGFPSARKGVVQCEEYVLDEAGIIQPLKESSRSAA